jgi:hypothetical protein
VLGIDAGSADLSKARPNASLGMAETEFLRRLNEVLPSRDEIPDWFYMWNVKETVAHQALAGRGGGARLVLPADRDAWAKEQSETLIAGLRTSGYDIVGDLDDLRPPHVTEPPVSPSDQSAGQMLDAAVQAAAALVVNQYQRQNRAARPPEPHSRGLSGRLEAAIARSPRLKRAVREFSSRYPAVRRLRVLAWRAMERTRTRGR